MRWLVGLIFALGLLWSGIAQAACHVHSYLINGRMMIVRTCCTAGVCQTTCE